MIWRPPKGPLVFFRDDKGQACVIADRLVAIVFAMSVGVVFAALLFILIWFLWIKIK